MTMIIAELSGNHGGDFNRARALVKAAADAGASAIKTQCFDPETLTLDSDRPGFVIEHGIWKGRKLIDLYRETAMPWDWHERLSDLAAEEGMGFISSVFCRKSVDHIAALDPEAIKIASLEANDLPLIYYAASKSFPMIISCGMTSPDEREDIINTVRRVNVEKLTLLHCPPGYPSTSPGFSIMERMKEEDTSVFIGFSDHSLSVVAPALAVARGADVIEKHLILTRAHGGPDAAFSLEPQEFKTMVDNCREAEGSLGSFPPPPSHAKQRRSLYVVEDIAAGEEITDKNVRSIRPGLGAEPEHMNLIRGRKATCDLKKGEPMRVGYVE